MDFDKFLSRILDKVNALLPDGLSADFRTIQKNNGVSYTCLCLNPHNDEEASPAIYMEPVFDMLSDYSEEELYKAAERLSELLCRRAPEYIRRDILGDPDFARAHLVYRLSSRKGNEEWLARMVYREYLDLAVTYGVLLNDGESDSGFMTVTRELADRYGMNESDLFSYAEKNTKRLLGDNLAGFYDALPETEEGEGKTIYILSNRENFYGAAALLYSEELRSLADRLESDLFILPASVHEVILLPRREEDYLFMKKTVERVNSAEKKKENNLSDSVYVYERATGRIRIAP